MSEEEISAGYRTIVIAACDLKPLVEQANELRDKIAQTIREQTVASLQMALALGPQEETYAEHVIIEFPNTYIAATLAKLRSIDEEKYSGQISVTSNFRMSTAARYRNLPEIRSAHVGCDHFSELSDRLEDAEVYLRSGSANWQTPESLATMVAQDPLAKRDAMYANSLFFQLNGLYLGLKGESE